MPGAGAEWIVPTLRFTTEIAAPVETCFDLSRSIDLHLESMLASRERAVGGVTSGLIGAGQEVSWEAHHLGVRWRMTSRITEFEPPHRFVDEMVRGPFAAFRHEHLFTPGEGGGTVMTDVVDVRMGWGPLGPLADIFAAAYLRRLLRIRNAAIKARAER
jgi:ligand-binding SRPBCC domain-containing protein